MRNSPQTLRVWVTSEYCPVLMKKKKGLKVEKEGEGLRYIVLLLLLLLLSLKYSFRYDTFDHGDANSLLLLISLIPCHLD